MDNFNNNQQGYQQQGQPMQQGYQQGQPIQQDYQQQGQPMQGGYQQQGQPMGGYQQQGQPMGGYQQQGQPMGGYQQPMGGYQQPMGGYQQPMGGYQQPMGGYQQPMGYGRPAGGANIGGYFNMLSHNITRLVGVICALLIAIAPFFNWMSYKISYKSSSSSKRSSDKAHANAFKLASDDYLDNGLIAFLAILIIVVGVCLIVWDMADYVPAIGNIKYKMANAPIEYILLALALIFGLIIFFNGDLTDGIDYMKDSLDEMKDYYDSVKGHANHGFGPILLWVGIAGKAVTTFMNGNANKRY